MSDAVPRYEEFVRRLAATARGATLYAPDHPIVQRGVGALTTLCGAALQRSESLVLGVIGDEIVVNGERLHGVAAALTGFARELRDLEVEKLTFARGTTRDELNALVVELSNRRANRPLQKRLEQKNVRRITVGRINVEETEEPTGIAAARRIYSSAVDTAQSLWEQARAGDKPDPRAAQKIIDSLAKMVSQDRTSLMALTALKRYDNYTFTHMVNVSVLAMAQARSLNLEGPLLREFGFAALMHDIGKVHTPLEVLNKPDRLTKEEFDVMKQHVVDGAHILRRTPEMPALAPVVAFEHHLRQDLSGYPENIGHRDLNLCTQIVSIADVYDALRSNRIYREGLPSERIRAIMTQKDSPAFNTRLLRRFINLMGLFPIGTLVRLETDEVGVVTHEHPGDPFRPQVKVLLDRLGQALEEPVLINTWEAQNARRGVVEAVDPDTVQLDPLAYL
ncbi:MAG TPA: HD-GYP domain-containing protein [Vicinamibacterales bacterium]|nr:HD-GYP domain-containing protein [Vicinamibacterales bacterium]